MYKFTCLVSALSLGFASVAFASPRQSAAKCVSGDAAALSVAGDVLISSGGAFTPAANGAQLVAGDRILIQSGVAAVFVGQKQIAQGGAGSMLSVAGSAGSICVSKAAQRYVPQQGETAAASDAINPLWVAAGLGVVGAGAGVAVAAGSRGSGDNQQGQNLWWATGSGGGGSISP